MNDCTHIEFIIDPDGSCAEQATELAICLANLRGVPFADVGVSRIDFPSMRMLVNGPDAWLLYVRYHGDPGFHSVDPDYDGDVSERLPFFIENGYDETFPRAWTVPMMEACRALVWFAVHGTATTRITWSNDSGDGNTSPDDPFETR